MKEFNFLIRRKPQSKQKRRGKIEQLLHFFRRNWRRGQNQGKGIVDVFAVSSIFFPFKIRLCFSHNLFESKMSNPNYCHNDEGKLLTSPCPWTGCPSRVNDSLIRIFNAACASINKN
jgi:hypothetical protein